MNIEPPTYKIQISGTRVSHIVEISLILPKIITDAAKVITIAKTQFGTFGKSVMNELLIADA